jgi:hypothetical protein
MTPEKKFEFEFFGTLLDTALMSIKDWSKCINTRRLGVSCTRLANCQRERARKHCSDFQLTLNAGSDAGTVGGLPHEELISIQKFVENLKNPTPLGISNFIKKFAMEELYPNIWCFFKNSVNFACCRRQ